MRSILSRRRSFIAHAAASVPSESARPTPDGRRGIHAARLGETTGGATVRSALLRCLSRSGSVGLCTDCMCANAWPTGTAGPVPPLRAAPERGEPNGDERVARLSARDERIGQWVSPVPGADVAVAGSVPVQMREGRTCRRVLRPSITICGSHGRAREGPCGRARRRESALLSAALAPAALPLAHIPRDR